MVIVTYIYIVQLAAAFVPGQKKSTAYRSRVGGVKVRLYPSRNLRKEKFIDSLIV
jgi:hypothetical protein